MRPAVIALAGLAAACGVALAIAVTTPPEVVTVTETPPPVVVTVPTPVVVEKVVEKVVTERVEVPVTEIVTETVEKVVEVPGKPSQQQLDAEYVQGYTDGRIEGEEYGRESVALDGGAIDPANLAAALDTPCAQEDSTNCYWDAALMGNGQGTSFLNVEGHIFPMPVISH